MKAKEKNKALNIFAFASFLNDFGSDMIYPIWPVFITSILGANMTILGFLDGIGEAIVSLAPAISGYFADKINKRKPFIWIGYLLASFSRIGYAFSLTWQQVVPFRILDRMGKIRSAPRDAIVADLSQLENRGKNFGFLRALDNLGAVAGIVFCLLFFNLLGYKKIFLLASIPSLIGAFLILFFIKEKKKNLKESQSFIFFLLNKDFKKFLFLSFVFSLGSFTYSFLLIYAQRVFSSFWVVPFFYLVFTLVAFLVSIPFGKLTDKIGRRLVLVIAFGFWMITCLVFVLSDPLKSLAPYLMIFAFLFYGCYRGAIEPSQRAFASELVPQPMRASALGNLRLVIGLGSLPGSFLAGFLWENLGRLSPFLFSLFLTLVSTFFLFQIKETKVENNLTQRN